MTDDPIRELLGVGPPTDLKWINALFFGDPGAGKTHLIGTAMDHPETRPLLLLDIDGGAQTVRKRTDIDVIQVRTMQKLENVVNDLRKSVVDGKMYYKCVAVDSLTEFQKLDMRTVMKQAKADARDSSKVDELVPSQREWGKSNERVRMVIRAFKDLDCHFLATAFVQETRKENKSEGTSRVIKIAPSLPGKLGSEVPGFFDIVGLLRVQARGQGGDAEQIRTLQTQQTELVKAKDRFSALPALMDHPSIPLIWETIYSDS